MRRLVNFRVPLFIAIGFILGVLSFYEFLFGNFWFGLVVLVLIFALGITLFVLKSKLWLGVISVLLAVSFGFILSNVNYNILNKNEATDKDVLITGRVCDLNRNGEPTNFIYLENCIDSDGAKYNGRIRTYMFSADVKTGDILTIRGTLNTLYPIKNSIETYYLKHNIRYDLKFELLVSQTEGELKLDETIRKYIYDISTEYAPLNGDVMYALLTGDRNALSTEKESYFKAAGIIHLLAVSGLHVGFVVALFCFFLKRFKLHPLVELIILLIPLVFYAYICNFTPSVIRAIVMVACSYIARSVFGRYDLLTSLSFAVIVILLISPFNLFDVGFQLSVLSVYGIATLYGTINRLLAKRKIHRVLKYFINSLIISLSCSVATFFTMQLNFGYAPMLGILLNLLAIPLVGIVFTLSWIGMIPWVFHYILFAADYILEFVVISAKWVSNLSFSVVSVSAIAAVVVVIVGWLFVLGGYVNLRKIGKAIVNSVFAVLVVLCIALSCVKVNARNRVFVAYGYDDVMCVITSTYGETALIGNFSDARACNQAIKYINKYKIEKCSIYITDYSNADANIIEDVVGQLSVDSVYKLNFAYNSIVDDIINNHNIPLYQQMENTSQGNHVVITSVYDGGLRAVIMRTSNLTATVVFGDDYAVSHYLDLGISSDVYILPNANKTYSDFSLTTLSLYQSNLPFNYGANKYGNFTIAQKGATITIKFR